ncbi:putative ABC transport system permease protein [Sinosporangium album]|uniref:Putative ABC transport system permease protein n=1 Tax=Sinosporangium album TaxID=504805 RepID=A0A1G8AV80_9ACTN|nr:ABC transporter permease [Sinosporangium album]SDH24942.1 putative ABC transport system permease protein [Sinosporangium album]
MNGLLPVLRLSLRLSIRGIRRAKGRSALIAAMVGVPVMVFTAFFTIVTTADVSHEEGLPWTLGSADAKIFTRWYMQEGAARARPATAEELSPLLPPGSRLLRVDTANVPYRTDRWHAPIALLQVDFKDPLTRGMVRLTEGRMPTAAGEIAVSAQVVEAGARVGQDLTIGDSAAVKRVVGAVEGPPHTFLIAAPGGGVDGGRTDVSWLVDAPRPLLRHDLRNLDGHGFSAVSRAVAPASETPASGSLLWGSGNTSLAEHGPVGVLFGLTMSLIVVEVALLAGSAFMVGERRRRRELALVVAQGGEPRHVRTLMMADGLLLGALGSVLGAALGVALVFLLQPLIAAVYRPLGPFDVPWWDTATVIGLGVVSALLACLVPARRAARADTAAALAGRRIAPRSRRGLPVAGAALLVAGTAGAVAALWANGAVFLIGCLLVQLGLVLLAPTLVDLVGALSSRAPLPIRLAARDAVRHRGRTAPAVVAVTAAVAMTTAIGVSLSSTQARHERDYSPLQPLGAVVVEKAGHSREKWAEVGERLRMELRGVPLIEQSVLVSRAPGQPEHGAGSSIRIVGCAVPCVLLGGRLPVGNAALLRYLLGRNDHATSAALDAGKVIAFDPAVVRDGHVKLKRRGPTGAVDTITMPAVLAHPATGTVLKVLLPKSAANTLGLAVEPYAYVINPRDHAVGEEERQRLNAALLQVTYAGEVRIERGWPHTQTFSFALLTAAVTAVALAAALVAAGLARVDARPDIASLASVGATRRVRRLFTAGQAGIIVGSGAVVGVLLGLALGVAAYAMAARPPGRGVTSFVVSPDFGIDLPWLLLGGMVIVLPLAAMGVAALFTRAEEPLTRRLA